METEATISATVAEKRKRGRPPVWDKAYVETLARVCSPDTKSIRGKQNCVYRAIALNWINDSPDREKYLWLADKDKMMQGGVPHSWRPTLLAELGRLREEDFFPMAEALCREKPTTRDGLLMIRRYRFGQNEHNQLNLIQAILDAITEYEKRFPNLTEQQIRNALSDAAWCMFDSEKENEANEP